jgi:hypothetical protein
MAPTAPASPRKRELKRLPEPPSHDLHVGLDRAKNKTHQMKF